MPAPLPVTIEVREANLKLLYQFADTADTQLPHLTNSHGATRTYWQMQLTECNSPLRAYQAFSAGRVAWLRLIVSSPMFMM
jgi:hypothetical protein